jgi:hypothetical protein
MKGPERLTEAEREGRGTGKPNLPGGREEKPDRVHEHMHVNVDVDVVVRALVDGCCLVRGSGTRKLEQRHPNVLLQGEASFASRRAIRPVASDSIGQT